MDTRTDPNSIRRSAARGARAASRLAAGVMLAALVATCAAPSATPFAAVRHASAADACIAAAGGASWTVAAEVDHPDASAIALVLGSDIAPCLTSRGSDGYGPTLVGRGTFPVALPARLTYLTGTTSPDGRPRILVGRIPDQTSEVRLAFGDGSTTTALVGRGIWLAFLSQPSTPTSIEALDASGTVIDRLANEGGVEPQG